MKKKLAAVGAGTAGLLMPLALVTPAEAATLTAGCDTTGASGGVTVKNFDGATDRIDFYMNVTDTKADGAHARVRLVTKSQAGTTKYWPWRSNTKGANKMAEWNSYAKENSGIFDVGVQVARFSGSTKKNHCSKWGSYS